MRGLCWLNRSLRVCFGTAGTLPWGNDVAHQDIYWAGCEGAHTGYSTDYTSVIQSALVHAHTARTVQYFVIAADWIFARERSKGKGREGTGEAGLAAGRLRAVVRGRRLNGNGIIDW